MKGNIGFKKWFIYLNPPIYISLSRFEKRHKNISVHLSPCFRDTAVGDVLTVGECRWEVVVGLGRV